MKTRKNLLFLLSIMLLIPEAQQATASGDDNFTPLYPWLLSPLGSKDEMSLGHSFSADQSPLALEPEIITIENEVSKFRDQFIQINSNLALTDAQIKDIFALFPQIKSIHALPKRGVNTAYEIEDISGKKHFLKYFRQEEGKMFTKESLAPMSMVSLHEAAASQLASYLTNNLVPAGRSSGSLAITYPFVKIDKTATEAVFKSVYPDFKEENIYPLLNERQRAQLFVHMVSDLILENPDTHSNQFGIDETGNLISFDKGRSHLATHFEAQTDIPVFALDSGILTKSKIYGPLIKHLEAHSDDLKKILNSPEVLALMDTIYLLKDEKIKTTLKPFFDYLSVAIQKKTQQSSSISDIQDSYLKRINEMGRLFDQLFSLEPGEFRRLTLPPVRKILNYTHNNDVHWVSFDPRLFHPKLVAAVSSQNEAHINGATVLELMEDHGAIAGINGGYWDYAEQLGAVGFWATKIASAAGLGDSYLPKPSAILQEKPAVLIQDTEVSQAAIGWTRDGSQTLMGNLKIAWKAQLPASPQALQFIRVTDLAYNEQTQYAYFKTSDSTNQFFRATIQDGRIQELVTLADIDKSLSNGYIFDDENGRNVKDWTKVLKVGDVISITPHYISEVQGWDKMDQILTAGTLLISDGLVQSSFPGLSAADASSGTESKRTAICTRADASWMMFVFENTALRAMAHFLKDHGCQNAVNLDGGRSSTLQIADSNNPVAVLPGRKVSDALVVLPKQFNQAFFAQPSETQRFFKQSSVQDNDFAKLFKKREKFKHDDFFIELIGRLGDELTFIHENPQDEFNVNRFKSEISNFAIEKQVLRHINLNNGILSTLLVLATQTYINGNREMLKLLFSHGIESNPKYPDVWKKILEKEGFKFHAATLVFKASTTAESFFMELITVLMQAIILYALEPSIVKKIFTYLEPSIGKEIFTDDEIEINGSPTPS